VTDDFIDRVKWEQTVPPLSKRNARGDILSSALVSFVLALLLPAYVSVDDLAYYQVRRAAIVGGSTTTTTTPATTTTTTTLCCPVVDNYNSGATTPTAATNTTVSKPSSVVSDDTLIVLAGNDSTDNNAQFDATTNNPRNDSDGTDAGFTFIGHVGTSSTDTHVGAWYRIADGTEESTLRIQARNSADLWVFYILVKGANATTPFDAKGANYSTSASSTHAILGYTSAANSRAFYVLAFDGSDGVPFSISGTGWSQTAEIKAENAIQSPGNEASGVWGEKEMPSAAATGTATVGSNKSDGAAAFQFTIKK
jgi:hypothetical protein